MRVGVEVHTNSEEIATQENGCSDALLIATRVVLDELEKNVSVLIPKQQMPLGVPDREEK